MASLYASRLESNSGLISYSINVDAAGYYIQTLSESNKFQYNQTPASTPAGKTQLHVITSTNITMMAAVSHNKNSSQGRDSRPFTFYPHSDSSKPTKE